MESADVHRSQTRDSDVCIYLCVWDPLKNLIVETFLGDAIKKIKVQLKDSVMTSFCLFLYKIPRKYDND